MLGAVIFAAVPAWLFTGPVGPFRVPGLEGEGLYGQLFAGAVVRGWGTGGGPLGVVTMAGGAVPFWPASPMTALLQALLPLDAAWALGVVLWAAVWLAGFGPWRLVRRVAPGVPWWAGVCAALMVQTSPVVLRALPGVDLAALAVGPVALGLAHPWLAWVGGAWSLPGALLFGVAGLLRRRVAWMLAALPALALLLPASPLAGAMRPEVGMRGPSSPAYVADNGSVFPLPPDEQAPIRAAAELARTGLWLPADVTPSVRGNLFRGPPPTPGTRHAAGPEAASPAEPVPVEPVPRVGGPTPDDPLGRPWIGAAVVPLQRLYGGPAIGVGIAVGLLFAVRARLRRPRVSPAENTRWAPSFIGILTLVALTLLFGWQAAPGELEQDPLTTTRLAGLLSPARAALLPGGGASAWSALLPLAGALGILPLLAATRIPVAARVALGVLLAGVGVPLENPRLVAPVASIPPDPIRETLDRLPADTLILFPAPQWPYLQGQRPAAAALWEAAATGQRIEREGEDRAAAGIIGALSALADLPVDVQAARIVWEGHATEPILEARRAGWRYLLVDLEALAPAARPRVDGWLAERAGMPVARDGARLLYDLSEGPAGRGREGAPKALVPPEPVIPLSP